MKDILCRFCGAKMGEIQDTSDVVDSRCDACESTHGNFKEMEKEFFHRGLGDYDDFKVIMEKAQFKKSLFNKEIIKKLGKK